MLVLAALRKSKHRQKFHKLNKLQVPQKKRKHPQAPTLQHVSNFSDGNFEALSKGWRNGIGRLVKDVRCKAHDRIIWSMVSGNRLKYLLAKAQMMVESNCDWLALGGGTDYGLFQVQVPTCAKDVAVSGNLFDPATNIRCATAYLEILCKRHNRCALPELYTAYNAGPTGSLAIVDKRAFQYVRKIHFAFRALVEHERRSAGT